MRAAFLGLLALHRSDAGAIECQSCTFATGELLKSYPVLSKPEKREGDKALALGDALPTMCLSNVFKGLNEAAALAAACKPFSEPEGPVATALLAGGDAAGACAAACEGVAEDARAPAAAAPQKAKPAAKKGGAAGKGRKGTVDDPQYAAALKAKAKRDAKRKSASAAPEEAEL